MQARDCAKVTKGFAGQGKGEGKKGKATSHYACLQGDNPRVVMSSFFRVGQTSQTYKHVLHRCLIDHPSLMIFLLCQCTIVIPEEVQHIACPVRADAGFGLDRQSPEFCSEELVPTPALVIASHIGVLLGADCKVLRHGIKLCSQVWMDRQVPPNLVVTLASPSSKFACICTANLGELGSGYTGIRIEARYSCLD